MPCLIRCAHSENRSDNRSAAATQKVPRRRERWSTASLPLLVTGSGRHSGSPRQSRRSAWIAARLLKEKVNYGTFALARAG